MSFLQNQTKDDIHNVLHLINKKRKNKMRKALYMLFVLALCLSLFACGNKGTPSGKYYWETSSSAYYQFDGNNKCYLYVNSSTRCEYLYTVNEDDDPEGVFVIHITDVSSDSSHKLIYDTNTDCVWDPDLGFFYKK